LPRILCSHEHGRFNLFGSGFAGLGAVEQIALHYGAALKVCLATQEDLGAIGDAYHTTGTPAFLFFRQGKEKGRLRGQVDEANLMVFINRSLLQVASAGHELSRPHMAPTEGVPPSGVKNRRR
jgi:hypothetical protein